MRQRLKPKAAPLTQRQPDSVIGASGVPGASGIRGAMRVADSQTARNARAWIPFPGHSEK